MGQDGRTVVSLHTSQPEVGKPPDQYEATYSGYGRVIITRKAKGDRSYGPLDYPIDFPIMFPECEDGDQVIEHITHIGYSTTENGKEILRDVKRCFPNITVGPGVKVVITGGAA